MPRVLIVAYAFPPDLATGARRPWGLYRHLGEYGWDPALITASAGERLPNVHRIPHQRFAERVRSLLGLRPDARGAIANAMRRARQGVSLFAANPEDESSWRRPAFAAALERLDGEAFDAILSTSPPVTAHLVARDLKRRTGLPWIADFRDLWADNYSYPWSEFRRSLDRLVERRVLRDADALVTVSEPLARTLGTRHPNQAGSIPNGFAPEDMAEPDLPLSDRFSITYTGTLYPGKRDPRPLFRALATLIDRRVLDPGKLELRFYGRNVDQPSLLADVTAQGLRSSLVVGGLLPRAEMLQRQRESQILLALDWTDEREPGVTTGKIFEYLAAGRPILGVGPSGSVADLLLRETSAGRQCSTEGQTEDFLLESYRDFERTGRVPYRGNARVIRRHDHIAMSRQFAELLTRTSAGGVR